MFAMRFRFVRRGERRRKKEAKKGGGEQLSWPGDVSRNVSGGASSVGGSEKGPIWCHSHSLTAASGKREERNRRPEVAVAF